MTVAAVLLAGGVTLNLPGWPDNGVTAVPGAVSAVDEAPAGQASAAQAPGVSAVRVSSVRWIAPAKAPAPQAQAAKTAPPSPKPAPTEVVKAGYEAGVLTVAAAEVGVGLAIVLLIYRNLHSIDLDRVDQLKG